MWNQQTLWRQIDRISDYSDKYPEDCFIKNVNINENEPRKSCWKGLHKVLWKSIFEDPSMILFWLTFSMNWSVKSKAYRDLLESCELHLFQICTVSQFHWWIFHASYKHWYHLKLGQYSLSCILHLDKKNSSIGTKNPLSQQNHKMDNWKNTSIYQGTTVSLNSSTVF